MCVGYENEEIPCTGVLKKCNDKKINIHYHYYYVRNNLIFLVKIKSLFVYLFFFFFIVVDNNNNKSKKKKKNLVVQKWHFFIPTPSTMTCDFFLLRLKSLKTLFQGCVRTGPIKCVSSKRICNPYLKLAIVSNECFCSAFFFFLIPLNFFKKFFVIFSLLEIFFYHFLLIRFFHHIISIVVYLSLLL